MEINADMGDGRVLILESDAEPARRASYCRALDVDDDELDAMFADAAKALAKTKPGVFYAVIMMEEGRWHLVLMRSYPQVV